MISGLAGASLSLSVPLTRRPSPSQLYVGNASGRLLVVDVASLKVERSLTVSTDKYGGIKGISFDRKGSVFLVNCGDKALHMYS